MIARALNQKTACHLCFREFLDLAQALDCVGIEARNDLGRPFFDGMVPRDGARMVADHGLRLLGLSEVYAFNIWDDERAEAVRALIETAQASGAETISLIPCVDDRGPAPTERDQALRDVMERILPMLEGTNITALIEPIGFEASSLRRKAELIPAIEACGAGRFALVHDTFQHCIAGETAIFPEHTAIVHISGISEPDATLDAAQDGHRILVDTQDRLGNVGQIRAFLATGYDGAFSFECTEARVRESPTLQSDILRSFNLIEEALSA